jgi:hypothetical protein
MQKHLHAIVLRVLIIRGLKLIVQEEVKKT